MQEPISPDESLRRLRDFVHNLETLLKELSEHPGLLIPGRHHDAMMAAWIDVQPRFPALIDQLQPPKAPSANSELLIKLKEVGLLGNELVFKLSIFQHAHDDLRDELRRKEGAREGIFKRGWRVLKRLWKRALKAGDVILGSLARALPLSPAEAIKEYKEAAEAGLELGTGVAEVVYPTGKNDPGA